MPRGFISISTDFGPGNKGIGVMRAVMLGICPHATIIDLANDITGFDIKQGAKLLEATAYLPIGCHLCVVDPGVGTRRRAIIIQTGRGDFLVGPDNGVLIPATRFLGGIANVYEITNATLMRTPVSPIFHGRDIFAPAAAHLTAGTPIEQFGPSIPPSDLAPAAYEEAVYENGSIDAEVILINAFGSVFLNIMQTEMHKLCSVGDIVNVHCGEKTMPVPYQRTFGDVQEGEDVMMDDDFGRVEMAANRGSFAKKYNVKTGDPVTLRKR